MGCGSQEKKMIKKSGYHSPPRTLYTKQLVDTFNFFLKKFKKNSQE